MLDSSIMQSRLALFVADLWKRVVRALAGQSTEEKREMADPQHPSGDLQRLAWLADAPLFIDGKQVQAFYDAIVRPEAEAEKITLSLKSLQGHKASFEGEGGGKVSVASWLTKIFPFLDASVEGKLGASYESSAEDESGRTVEFKRISSPQRQLVQLTFHYVLQLPSRFKIVSDPSDSSWYTPEFVNALPRALVFIEFPPGTFFAPMAAELSNGDVIPLHEELARAFGGTENPNPRPAKSSRDEAAWDTYWRWYSDNFNSLAAMETLENLVKAGKSRIHWVDYRVPAQKNGRFLNRTIHLHVSGGGEHDTGVFAYNLIRRGHEHGIRIVGTLKSGPDINVLAMFET